MIPVWASAYAMTDRCFKDKARISVKRGPGIFFVNQLNVI